MILNKAHEDIETIQDVTNLIYEIIIKQFSIFTITKIVQKVEDALVGSKLDISEENVYTRVVECVKRLQKLSFVVASCKDTYVVIVSEEALKYLIVEENI